MAKRKYKKKSEKAKLKEKLWNVMREYVRMRDKHQCQKCGKVPISLQDKQTSHVLSRGSHPRLAFEPENVKLLCMYCHRWWHQNPLESARWFEEKFPERLKLLQSMQNDIAKLNVVYLQEKIEWYKSEIKEMERGGGDDEV